MGSQKMPIREATFEGSKKLNNWEKLLETLLGVEQPKVNASVVIKFYIDRL
jgi:hypothetical protein